MFYRLLDTLKFLIIFLSPLSHPGDPHKLGFFISLFKLISMSESQIPNEISQDMEKDLHIESLKQINAELESKLEFYKGQSQFWEDRARHYDKMILNLTAQLGFQDPKYHDELKVVKNIYYVHTSQKGGVLWRNAKNMGFWISNKLIKSPYHSNQEKPQDIQVVAWADTEFREKIN